LEVFSIPVCNELSGEIRIVDIASEYFADAQVAALHRMFAAEGWRKAVALMPEARTQVA
jgi:hypothetical protein